MHSCISHTGIEQEKDFTQDAVPSMYAAMSHCMRVCWRPAENCAKFRWPQKKIFFKQTLLRTRNVPGVRNEVSATLNGFTFSFSNPSVCFKMEMLPQK